MAKEKRHVPRPIKRQLMEEAGGKCANPGCANTRLQFHHLKYWVVYKTHSPEDMIAVCPSCHDAAHHGDLKITDATLREWKTLKPDQTSYRDVLFVDASHDVSMLFGPFRIKTTKHKEMIAFRLSNQNELSFGIENSELS